ncbi:MAG: polysaccharide deacetylase family protein [Gaiellales bacterium]
MLATHPFPAVSSISRWPRAALGIEDQVAEPGAVALTFDDGPHPEGTPAVLELLAAAGVRATFFLVGEQAERYPGLCARIAAEGHTVGLHCHRHRLLLRLSPSAVADDLARAHAAIIEAASVEPRLYRPPYGVFTAASLALARRYGWRPVHWRRWGRDWEARAMPTRIAARLTDRVQPCDVLLLHDADHYAAPGSWRNTVAALPLVLSALARSGLRPIPIDDRP